VVGILKEALGLLIYKKTPIKALFWGSFTLATCQKEDKTPWQKQKDVKMPEIVAES
jgi:hypothetical protein